MNLKAALKLKCPKCTKGNLYQSALQVNQKCNYCGYLLKKIDSADGPAFFVMTILGFVFSAIVLFFELKYKIPLYISLTLWPSSIILLSYFMLIYTKSILINIQYEVEHE